MCEHWHQKPLGLSPALIRSAERETDVFETGANCEPLSEGRAEHWRQNVRVLQEWICELLIRNQELRVSLLDSVSNKQSWKTDQ